MCSIWNIVTVYQPNYQSGTVKCSVPEFPVVVATDSEFPAVVA